MATVLVSSRRAARARMLGGTHARRYDAAAMRRDTVLFPKFIAAPRHRKEGTS